jgi:hypothetical protein
MPTLETGQASATAETVQIDHWVYGVVQGEGYTVKAVSKGLNASFYDAYLRGHYTPIRPATVQGKDEVDLQMVHPVRSGEEMLLSRVSRGLPDEAGRPTFVCHTAVVPIDLLRGGQVTLVGVYQLLQKYKDPDGNANPSIEPFELPLKPRVDPSSLGHGIHRYITLAALETLATRMMSDARNRTLLLCRDSTPDNRNRTLYKVIELLNWGCGLPEFPSITDSPTASSLNFFNLVVASRGVRSDASWAIMESTLASVALPRVKDRDQVYAALASAFRQSKDARAAL